MILKKIQFGEDQLLIVQTFAKQVDANDYHAVFKSGPARVRLGKMASDYSHFLINSNNFKELIKSADITSYLDFYKEKYPQ